MELYIEKETAGEYGLVDTFINETVSLNTKTTYTQDITAVFKGFTNSFPVQASPNNIKLLGYFGYTEQFIATTIEKRAKLYLNGILFKKGIITLENTSWINSTPSLFQLSFSDGQKNLTETLGEDTLAMLASSDSDITWSTKVIQSALQSIQSSVGGMRWFIPLVSTQRIFTISNSVDALPTDNIVYQAEKPITSENVLLPQEIRPALFISEILDAINKKYDIKIDPTPYTGGFTQLTDLATMCTAEIEVKEKMVKITQNTWNYDLFREERFNVIIKPLSPPSLGNVFELNYLGYGAGAEHAAGFYIDITLSKTPTNELAAIEDVDGKFVYSLEVWEVFPTGEKKKKLPIEKTITGAESGSCRLQVGVGLGIFTPDGGNQPSTLIKPLISVFASVDALAEWKYTAVSFRWGRDEWTKAVLNNVQPLTALTTVNLFKSLPDMKVIDFIKSIYTMFGYKKFKEKVLNDFYYVPKSIDSYNHVGVRVENDLTPYADLSKLTKKTNTKYDGYNLKHATSEYQQNVKFSLSNSMEWGQLKYPLTGMPKTEFKIETKFTAPVFSPVATNADSTVLTFYPFGSEPKLNESETRYIFDSNVKEFPIFYYHGASGISTPYALVDTNLKVLKSISNYHKISYKSNRVKTGADNYISSLFNTVIGTAGVPSDYIDQNTLYVQGFKTYIEDTLAGKKLIHTIDLDLPNSEIQKFEDSQEIIIKETKYNVLESTIGLTDGKTKLILLNK